MQVSRSFYQTIDEKDIKMKIKTITCHNVYNYGASLQAYGLQRYLESLGHNVEIINFRPWYNRGGYDLFSLPPVSRSYKMTKWCPLLRWIIAPIRNRHLLRTYGRKASFDEFTRRFLHVTATLYGDIEQLRANPPVADLYIAGSDQIWNTDMQNGHDPAFFLDFGSKAVRRLSYAASFGVERIGDKNAQWIKDQITRFNSVSVREKSGVEILKDLGFGDAVQVIDPVFLLSPFEWQTIAANTTKKYNLASQGYILLYDFINDVHIGEFAQKCALQTGLPIVAINDCRSSSYASYNITDAGPLEFVQLIANAAVVISNSFHATAFSCIFEKNFYTFPLSTQQNSSRMTDLLAQLNMTERFNPREMSYQKCDTRKLAELITRSKTFLQYQIR